MVITSNKHEGKPNTPYVSLSLCHVCVRFMHITGIPLARRLTHPCTRLSITLSHFLSSTSLEAESNRAHQTGWSEQNCDWQCPADSLWNSAQPCECSRMRTCLAACLQEWVHAPDLIVCMHACQCIYLPLWVCVEGCMCICTWVFLFVFTSPLSGASLRRRGGGRWRVGGSSLKHGVQRELWAPQVWITERENIFKFIENIQYAVLLLKTCVHCRNDIGGLRQLV